VKNTAEDGRRTDSSVHLKKDAADVWWEKRRAMIGRKR